MLTSDVGADEEPKAEEGKEDVRGPRREEGEELEDAKEEVDQDRAEEEGDEDEDERDVDWEVLGGEEEDDNGHEVPGEFLRNVCESRQSVKGQSRVENKDAGRWALQGRWLRAAP